MRNGLAWIDWRLNGHLSQLIETERLEGGLGECVMMPTQGRLQADMLILYGLGRRQDWNPKTAESVFRRWITKLNALQCDKWLLSFSGLSNDFLVWRHAVRAFVNLLVHSEPAVCRHLLLAESDEWVLEAKKRRMDFGSEVTLHYDLSGME